MIAKYKYDMMALSIRTAEEIVRSHTEMISNEKKNLTNQQVLTPKTFLPTINAISERQSNIIKHSRIILKQKLSFFDDAPMVIVEKAGTVGAMF